MKTLIELLLNIYVLRKRKPMFEYSAEPTRIHYDFVLWNPITWVVLGLYWVLAIFAALLFPFILVFNTLQKKLNER